MMDRLDRDITVVEQRILRLEKKQVGVVRWLLIVVITDCRMNWWRVLRCLPLLVTRYPLPWIQGRRMVGVVTTSH